ncbi:MAG TPA: polysaccharide deacetylase family protein [Panacibacter sp.]|nr:polysaccharide deacetylase family protein [Panacibacter sp.]
MVQIFTSAKYIPEKKYVFNVIFKEFWGIEYNLEFMEGMTDFIIGSNQIDSKVILPDIFFSTPDEKWLTKESLPVLPLKNFEVEYLSFKQHVPVIYGVKANDLKEQEYEIIIDVFGSIFFCLSLYEEYVTPTYDSHERFLYTQSIAFKSNYYHRPVVNEYLEILWVSLKKKFPDLEKKRREYKLILSHDVDWPLSNNLPIKEFLKECYRDLKYKKSIILFIHRIAAKALSISPLNYTVDPYNNFNFLMGVSEDNNIKSEFNFIPTNGALNPKNEFNYDNYYELDSSFFKSLLKRISKRGHIIGFHPSFYTLNNFDKLANEFYKFKRVCEEAGVYQTTWGGRHHYLRWQVSVSWPMWEELGLSYDSSVGSEFLLGFRCGTCYSFPVYDILKRQALRLREYPLIIMDMTVFTGQNLQDGLKKILDFKEICKTYNGDLTLLIHNNYIITPAWKRFYKSLVNQLSK